MFVSREQHKKTNTKSHVNGLRVETPPPNAYQKQKQCCVCVHRILALFHLVEESLWEYLLLCRGLPTEAGLFKTVRPRVGKVVQSQKISTKCIVRIVPSDFIKRRS